jgi:GT2 family glycosyltransferase
MTGFPITVGVATCGRPDGLTRCLQALAVQTKLPDEIIVVDQAPSGAARLAATNSGLAVCYLEQARLGLSASRNLALRRATGAILAVTDDDCEPDRGWVAALSLAFEQGTALGAVTGPILALGDPQPDMFSVSLRESNGSCEYRDRTIPWAVGSGGNFAAPVDFLQQVGGWDERLGTGSPGQAGEDSDLIYRLLIEGATIRYEAKAIVRHELQSKERRLATRWSYGYGIGAMCGIRLAVGDLYALRMLTAYSRLHARPLARAMRSHNSMQTMEHSRALLSLVPGLIYGLRTAGRRYGSGIGGICEG